MLPYLVPRADYGEITGSRCLHPPKIIYMNIQILKNAETWASCTLTAP